MKLKTVEVEGKTYAEVSDGKPVFVDDTGKDIAFDAPHSSATISRLNAEAKGHREAKEAAERALKAFDGLDDPEAARKALETLAGLDAGKLMDAEKAAAAQKAAVDAAIKTYTERAEAAEETASEAKSALEKEMIGGSFARSKYIAESMAVPAEMVQATFGRQFEIDGGKIVAKDANGNPIYSKATPGDLASFDEALEAIVSASPMRDHILKGLNQQGAGAKPGSGSGSKTISRAEFSELQTSDPAGAAKMMSEGYALTD